MGRIGGPQRRDQGRASGEDPWRIDLFRGHLGERLVPLRVRPHEMLGPAVDRSDVRAQIGDVPARARRHGAFHGRRRQACCEPLDLLIELVAVAPVVHPGMMPGPSTRCPVVGSEPAREAGA